MLALAAILLPVIIVFVHGYTRNKALLKQHTLDDLTVVAETVEGQVYQFLEMSKREAADFASDGLIIRDTAALDKRGPGSGPAREELERHLAQKKLPLDRHIKTIDIIDPRGSVIASTDAGSVGRKAGDEKYFASGAGPTVTEQKGPKGTGRIIISAPLTGPDGKTVGVIATHIMLSELNDVLSGEFQRKLGAISWNKGSRKLLDAYLVDSSGAVIAGSGLNKGSLPLVAQNAMTEPVAACVEAKKETSGFYTNYLGRNVASSSMCIPSLNWTLLVEYETGAALAPAYEMRGQAMETGAIVAGLIALFFVFFNSIVQRIKTLSSAAVAVSHGEPDVAVPVKSNDEIGCLADAFNTMASEIKQRDMTLRAANERLDTAQKAAHIGSWDWNVPEGTVWWSDESYNIFGVDPAKFTPTYESFFSMVHPDEREEFKELVDDALASEGGFSLDFRIVTPGLGIRTVHGQGKVIFGPGGTPVRMIGTMQDVTEREAERHELKKLSAAIEQSVNVIFITDVDGVIEYVNPMFERVTGYSGEDAVGQTPRILASGEVPDDHYKQLWTTILSGRTWRGSYKNRKKDGGYYWCNSVISPVTDSRGAITHFLAVQEDITRQKLTEEKAQYLAQYDGLTGLANRVRFMEIFEEWMAFAHSCGEHGALLLMDVDNFKYVNDTYGMGAGDEFLLRISKRFSAALERIGDGERGRTAPTLARLSGDEFAVLLPAFDEARALLAAEEFRREAEEFRPLTPPMSTTISVGVALYPLHGKTGRDLLTRVDASMYRAKELGRNRVHLYRPEDREIEKIHSRVSWKEKILKALREDRFEPWYQPILSLADDRIHHFEALARMYDSDKNVLLPGAFIDIAERFGLVGAIDRVITEKAMRKQAEMKKLGRTVSFGMNLSGKDLMDPGLLTFLNDKIKETGADPGQLIFEITETAAIGDLDKALEFIKSLKALGCRFSLDDFGVGFTSFTYLQEMEVDYIKIDGSFIKKLPESQKDQIFVKAMTEVARSLGVRTIAEFVENDEIFSLLKKLGVDYAQGYLIGKPGPGLVDTDAFLSTRRAG